MEGILNYLYGKYAPRAVILYGSYAEGTAGEGSDFDAILLADGPFCHDTAIIEGVQLDVWVYPGDAFTADEALGKVVQIADGILLHDPQGIGAALRDRVKAHLDAQSTKSAEENADALTWCRKMLTRTARGDAEGMYRWHWLLTDSLEICCGLLHQPYRGPKKSLRWLAQTHPELHAVYARALADFTQEALSAWVKALEELL